MISQQTIQQILSSIHIIDIVGSFVNLKKRGANYLGLCPFHNEKSPSFTVSPSKEIYKCFGCGRSGNAISFLMEAEKYSYVEALRWLAAKYNIAVEETEVSPAIKIQQQLSDSVYAINTFAQKFFTDQLHQTEEGKNIALSYLAHRGFTENTLIKFQLGYSPENKTSFANTVVAHQFNSEYLLKTGLVVMRNEELVDNYRGRIIFPIHNNSGRIIGFGARLIKKNDKAPKYINTPENELYVKGKILYGIYFARQAIDKHDECLLVEGYTDVISLHQAGIENVVASGGTALTIDQLRLIKKYTKNLTIIYDGDGAGIKAALRSIDMALEEGLQVQLVLIPDKEDPDSYVNKLGAAAFRTFIANNKKDFILFQLQTALQAAGTNSSQKAALVNQIAATIAKINKAEDFTKQQDYIRQCAQLLSIDEQGMNNLVNTFIRERVTSIENKQSSASPTASTTAQSTGVATVQENTLQDEAAAQLLFQDEMQERAVVRSLLEFGLKDWSPTKKVADYFFEEMIEEELFDNQQLYRVLQHYKTWYEAGLQPTLKNFLYHEDQALSAVAVSIMDVQYQLSDKWKSEFEMSVPTREETYQQEVISTLTYLKLRKIKRMILHNQQDLEKATTAEEQLMLIQTHQHLKQLEQSLIKEVGTVIMK
jgi:DNA primase